MTVAGHDAAAVLRAGAAAADITPEHLRGLNAMGADFTGVHDRLSVRALVLEVEARRVALVSADLLEIGVTTDLRRRIERQLGIPADAVLITATHSHNAPRAGRTPAGGLSRAASQESLAYSDWFFDRVVTVVEAALAALRPARLAAGRGHVDVNVNRDVLVGDRWTLGQNPAGPSDKTLRTVSLSAEDGAPIATLIGYAVHPTASLGSRLVSADVAGAACRLVEQRTGGVALWLPAAIGDQAVRQSLEHNAGAGLPTDPDVVFGFVEEQGSTIAAEVRRVEESAMTPSTRIVLGAAGGDVLWPAKPGTDLPPDMHQEVLDAVPLRLIGLVLGDVAVVGVSGEVTTAAAEQIQRTCTSGGWAEVLLVSIANERIGYLADLEAFRLGTFAARGCPVRSGWEAPVAERLRELLDETIRVR